MLRYITFIIALALLSGCSELQVIGNGALRELKSDGINVEAISYRYNQKLALREKLTGELMAKADYKQLASAKKAAAPEQRVQIAKANKKKGLWEKH